ncbi:MerR family transcriptional regulator [Oceanomicrobium pacificus]|uniref:MerR family transcriptional regulator n=1 Tax=Oceanomicrobium pacificus TaxID=2692916 RepID=A0A6B0TLT2_9RHOB|nr:MerR family transcriptional regulator [Oceanomicrobium pacificus]MXU65497.1 MerR family transcriptional regulator [Oceanomicrobium pacificus]
MEKSSQAFRTISEVSETLDVPAHVLRFWESKFSQIRPVKRGGGRRYYRPEDVNLLRGIQTLLYTEGLTIKGVQKVFKDKGQRHIITLGAEGSAPDDAPAAPAPAAPAPASDPSPTVEEIAMEPEMTQPSFLDEPQAAAKAEAAALPAEQKARLEEVIRGLEALRDEMRK